jgi:dihydropyrimidinase
MRKIVRGGTVVNASGSFDADVLIDGETIAGVGSFDGVDAEVIDAAGCFVLPGAIDNHTHMSMPFGGTHSSDDYDTGTQAAAAGGTTCIVDFALQMHPNGLRSSLEEWMGRAEGAAHVDYGFHMAITKADDETIADMGAMVEEGVTSFKVFMAYPNVLMVTDDQFLAVLEHSRDLGTLVMVHCENGFAIQHLVEKALANGQTDPIHHALTRPETMEAEATGRAIRLAEFAGAPLFVVHVSCRDAAEQIIHARSRGVAAYGETCIQYLFNSIDDLRRPDFAGARYVCSPPLRDAGNQPFLWDALRFDHLQSISTDHCPFTDEQKRLGLRDFSKIPNGLAAIQHRLPMMWEHGVREGRLSMTRVVDITSTAIAKMFGLYPRKGVIGVGAGHLLHERRLRHLRGPGARRLAAGDALARDGRVRRREDRHEARARPLRAPQPVRPARRVRGQSPPGTVPDFLPLHWLRWRAGAGSRGFVALRRRPLRKTTRWSSPARPARS